MKRAIRRAFTLVEILIVVVILGILAAVVVPQFVNASDEAQVGNVETQLRTLRTQVQLYRAQSDTNAFPLAASLWQDLIDDGLIQAEPVNPRTNSSDVGAEAADGQGWIYNEATGQLWAQGFNEDYRADDDTGDNDPWSAAWQDGIDFGGGGADAGDGG